MQTRRKFLGQCCAAVGTTGLLSALSQLRVIGAVAADSLDRQRAAAVPADFKALVCLYLQGGNDATNVLIPSDNSSYASYSKSRIEVAVAQSSLLSIAPRKYSDGRSWAMHGSVPGFRDLFASGKLAVLANVGTLTRPITLADYQAARNLPPQLFSHADQTIQWQSSIPDKPFDTGWGGRLADLVDAQNTNNQISMSITLNGVNSFQRGNNVLQFALGSGGVPNMLVGPDDPVIVRVEAQNARSKVFAAAYNNIHASAHAVVSKKALDDQALINSVLATAPTLATAFPGTNTAASLKMVARLISVASSLGLKRQIFFVQLPGFDLHDGQVAGHGPLLAELSGAMKAFYDATIELGVANQVTTFTASDFGRTYVSNYGGTDHGWGNHQFIMGGAVQGGDIYGQMMSLAVGGPDDTGRGRWIPTTSVDEYSATLATWFGVSDSNLPAVLPNIGRFAKPNLGFMG
ncbi:MAG: DUF1501 domain-containing protein [Verrucomicrobia bacterium]|nr:DUF1501 domain-containing protein [Verrucomicrobiota bacterium]